jgi:sugar phosphate isomerase/epimerase
MRLSASNIAWAAEDDAKVYKKLADEGYSGLEIAPTRLIPTNPYDSENIRIAANECLKIKKQWGLTICSMQSIWYGRKENIFGSMQERKILYDYTCKAIDFAKAIECPHIVFGNPKNRIKLIDDDKKNGENFFFECAYYAEKKDIIIGVEPNPIIYGTNYLNTTDETLELVKTIDSPYLKLNYDLGSVIENNESINFINNNISYISHIHVSEPYLDKIKEREMHKDLMEILINKKYKKWISIETKNSGVENLFDSLKMIKKTFLKLK